MGMKPRNQSNAKGIDVSRHQGNIDWPKVKVDFAFIKATEGIGYIDPQFRRNAADANAVGIPVGYYHYAHPETNSALAEAAAFIDATKGQACQLPYVLDLEGEASKLNKDALSKWAYEFMSTVKNRTGKPVMLYTGAYFARDQVSGILGDFPLWVAHYGASTPLANSTWNDWTFFQYSSSGSVAGIIGNVDMNEYNGSVENMLGTALKKEDANSIIKLLAGAYGVTADKEAQAEIHRLANELRRVSGQDVVQ